MAIEGQMIHNETTPGIPLIRLSVINPFLKELASRNCAAHSRRRSHRWTSCEVVRHRQTATFAKIAK